jgi:SAM-dependent methyltransferase
MRGVPSRRMSERTAGIRRPLANAGVYSLLQRALGADNVRRTFVRDYLRPRSGERILDLGCGPGDILDLLGDVEYLGVDNSEAYVQAARERYGDRARFIHGDVRTLSLDADERFDAAISIGVMHHLDDAGARAMTAVAASLLEPDGRLVTVDPAVDEQQAAFARWLISRDRGQSVRTAAGYESIAAERFGSVSASVHHELARVPYTHAILECRAPLR